MCDPCYHAGLVTLNTRTCDHQDVLYSSHVFTTRTCECVILATRTCDHQDVLYWSHGFTTRTCECVILNTRTCDHQDVLNWSHVLTTRTCECVILATRTCDHQDVLHWSHVFATRTCEWTVITDPGRNIVVSWTRPSTGGEYEQIWGEGAAPQPQASCCYMSETPCCRLNLVHYCRLGTYNDRDNIQLIFNNQKEHNLLALKTRNFVIIIM